MRTLYVLAFLCSCSSYSNQETTSPLACKGTYFERVNGELKKFNQYEQGGRCVTDNIALTQLEKTQENWTKKNVQCVPQLGFQSRTLVAENNYYVYRDGKAMLQFDSASGVFRRIILAENEKGEPVYAKLQGCFYQRTGTGVDSGFGKQLLLDTDVNKIITNQAFDPMEIFQYTETANEINMLRFDDTKDYDYRNCPYLRTPWQFCTKLRDGNEMYFPLLPIADQQALTTEAIIISRQFNWRILDNSQFDTLWDNVHLTRKDAIRENYKYDVIHIPDVPRYIDQAWRDYLMGNRPVMPDVNSNTAINLCYEGSKNITYSDGSTGRIRGQVCYTNGVYTFQPE